jgi:hypothetical protein
MERITWYMPIKTVSEANNTDKLQIKIARRQAQKRWVWSFFRKEQPKITLPCIITLIRYGRKELDDDNLPVSMKYIRDSIADQLIPGLRPGQADSDSRLTWIYEQKISNDYGVQVLFDFDLHCSLNS